MPMPAAQLVHCGSVESLAGDMKPAAANPQAMALAPPSRKRLRCVPTWFDDSSTLHGFLSGALPDKEALIPEWLRWLSAPSVCINTLEDVRRLDAEDISGLPVPPLVKGAFRELIAREASKDREQQAVLEATVARKKAFLAPLRDRNMQPPLAGSRYFQDLKSYRLILTHEEIEAGVRIVARRIETWCKGERIILVGILKGAFMLLSDLCRQLVRPYSVYFVEASSYKDERSQGSGAVQISSEVPQSKFCDATTKAPHKVVLIDELLDNGKTMQEMKQHFLSKLGATHTENDILTVCLFSKKRAREWPEADITGIPDLPDLWLVGYGLDDRGTKRGWSELFAMPKVKIVETIEVEEVERLMLHLDESAVLDETLDFAGFELSSNQKKRYRVSGLDVQAHGAHGTHGTPLHMQSQWAQKGMTKTDLRNILAGVSKVKGKYEQDLHFAFIQENVHLVPEDAIFSGDNKVYADLRCRLRRHISATAKRFGVAGLEDAVPVPS